MWSRDQCLAKREIRLYSSVGLGFGIGLWLDLGYDSGHWLGLGLGFGPEIREHGLLK